MCANSTATTAAHRIEDRPLPIVCVHIVRRGWGSRSLASAVRFDSSLALRLPAAISDSFSRRGCFETY
jgi:hypothetical protein